jgi:beta-glucosidase
MPWLNHVKSILQVWYPGSSAGTSLARVLYGEAEPGGRLPITFPADETQGPTRYKTGTVSYDEGVFVGYRYFQLHQQKPLFPFGHGLSYTTFALDQLTTSGLTAAKDDGKAAVSVRVRNSGKRAGSTVVQVYAGTLPTTVVATPARKLVGFAKVHLSAGEEETVRIEIDRRSLSYWDEALARWVTPTGVVPIYIGYSSENIVLNGEMPVR